MTIKFNGISKPFFHATVDTERPMWAPIEWDMVEIPGRPGAYPKQKKVKARPLSVSVVIKGVDDMEKAKEEVAEWLVTDEAKPLIFSDEPDRTYFAVIDGEGQLDDVFKYGKGTITFICPDPYKHGKESVFSLSTGITTISSAGSAPTYPIIEYTFESSANEFNVELLNEAEVLQAGVYLKYNFVKDDKLIIDFSKRLATVNHTKRNTAILIKSEFFKIPPKKKMKIRSTHSSTMRVINKYL
ncbi:phage tail family protein [Bacillus velezensis]|uniref:distal tail protein Dit n=1 Tax=Bacillus TaxID=1386 RepID=UPI000652B7C3|nr:MULTISPECIES: distal tail protein Dit [Bacillus]KMN56366.1 hypothetical protein VK94_08100 [Bacillus sp. LK7]MCW5196317.1 hypothetical protein [Bacillus amyloliquefaciens]MDU0078272.1 phage tail family protein [Bacillus sp. IG2]MDU0103977.1 phage tail family protein [Bacillus sp. IS1]MDX7897465.1 phage tail family protein [Bacillus velezensis]